MAACSVTHLPSSIDELLIVMEFIAKVPPRKKLSFHDFKYDDVSFVKSLGRSWHGEGHDDLLERVASIKEDAEVALRAYGNTHHGPRICAAIEGLCGGLSNLSDTYQSSEPRAAAKLNKVRESLLDTVGEYQKWLASMGSSL